MDYSDFIGVAELGDLLGLSKTRVGQLRNREDFPRPKFRLRATPVWSRSEVNAWADSRDVAPYRVVTPSFAELR
jgi:predicted DNA-binding transcriptional regulator AlpA